MNVNNLVNHFYTDKEYRGYVAKVLTLFNGDINYDDIHSIYPDTLKKLVKIKQNDVDKIAELEKENKQSRIEKLLESIASNCDTKKDKIKVHIKEENVLSINERNIKDSIELWDKFDNEECCKWFKRKYPESIITCIETYDYPDNKGVYLECFYNKPIKLLFRI